MKTKSYSLPFVLLVTVLFAVSSGAMAQRGRHDDRGRGYDRGYRSYSRYTPVRYSPVRYSPIRYSPVRYSPARYYSVRYYPQRAYYYNYPYLSIAFGGINYRYQSGYYYRPYGASFQLILPPFGIRIATLPIGYESFYVGPDPYYYYGGVYYRSYPGTGYEVVKPPLGAVVDQLPPGAKVTVIDGNKYYELSGTFYQESITEAGDLKYTVVGTDGVLNTDNTIAPENNPSGNDNNTIRNDRSSIPAVGDRFDDLPSNSKAVVIKGEKLFVSPTGVYYKEVIEGNKVAYEVVGK